MLKFFLSIIYLFVITAVLAFPDRFILAQAIQPTQSVKDSLGTKLDNQMRQIAEKGFSGIVFVAKNGHIEL
ncbi:MAG: hypothetical protein ABR566_18260, partial [Pyrinomonadaceae bacterium]